MPKPRTRRRLTGWCSAVVFAACLPSVVWLRVPSHCLAPKANNQPDQEKVLEFLESKGGAFVKTLDIAKAVVGPGATRSDVNPVLYTLGTLGVAKSEKRERGVFWAAPGAGKDATTAKGSRSPATTASFKEFPEEVEKFIGELKAVLARGHQHEFAQFADALAGRNNSEVEELIKKVNWAIAKVWPQFHVDVSLTGSRFLGTDINGSDYDFALHFRSGASVPAEVASFIEHLNESLQYPVERGNISIKIGMEPHVDIVVTEGDFNYNTFPYQALLGSSNRTEVNQSLTEFFRSYPGARRVTRVLKSLLLPLVNRSETYPWSFLIQAVVYAIGREKQGEHLQKDECGLLFFTECLNRFAEEDPQGLHPLWRVLLDARVDKTAEVHRRAFSRWRKATQAVKQAV